jgi:hypothetical protein
VRLRGSWGGVMVVVEKWRVLVCSSIVESGDGIAGAC